jgi:predicted transcriptional regulator
MRTSQIVSITLPPEMLSRATALAKKENRTMSELVREALRQYERHRWWEETNAYGRARAKALGIREEDVDRVIHEYRREKRARRKPGPK